MTQNATYFLVAARNASASTTVRTHDCTVYFTLANAA